MASLEPALAEFGDGVRLGLRLAKNDCTLKMNDYCTVTVLFLFWAGNAPTNLLLGKNYD